MGNYEGTDGQGTEISLENIQPQAGYQGISSLKTDITYNEEVTLTKYTVFSDSIREKDCKEKAVQEMERALSVDLKVYYEAQKRVSERVLESISS